MLAEAVWRVLEDDLNGLNDAVESELASRLAPRTRTMTALILHPDGLHRCPWPEPGNTIYVDYHDQEWGVPEYDDRALYEKLVLDGFQAGLSWITILRKRDNFRRAFDNFKPEKIARYDAKKKNALMQDAGIVRNRLKVEGTVLSARAYLDITDKGPGFSAFLWDFMDGKPKVNKFRDTKQVPAETPLSQKISKELSSRGFKFVGPTIVYAFMQAVGMVNDHLVKCHCYERVQKLGKKEEITTVARTPAKLPKEIVANRAWQRMLSGRRLDLLDPSPLDVEVADIAHGLARVARWNGQTIGAHIFSVAQHTLLVEIVARARSPRLGRAARLAIMLHDAPEYVIGDMISPFKAVIGDNYKSVELRLLAAIHLRFGLPAKVATDITRLIKAADHGAVEELEATRLAGFAPAAARRFFGAPPELSPAIEHDYLTPWPAETAEQRYLRRRFAALLACD